MTFPFPSFVPKVTVVSTGAEIDRTLGTNIGDMTSAGGLAAAFDGTTSQASTASASASGFNISGYVGKTGNIARIISSAIVYGSNNAGFYSGADPSTTISLYGKTGSAPANGTNGTLLGSVTFTDTANQSAGQTITSSDLTTLWNHWWVFIPANASGQARCAEVRFFE